MIIKNIPSMLEKRTKLKYSSTFPLAKIIMMKTKGIVLKITVQYLLETVILIGR